MFEISQATAAAPPTPPIDHWTIHPHTNAAFGLVSEPGASSEEVKYLGDFNEMNACWAACNKTAHCHEFVYGHYAAPLHLFYFCACSLAATRSCTTYAGFRFLH